jgi:hypothetical protein
MKDYKNCIMYKLYNEKYDEIYIGHTTLNLKERYGVHKYYANNSNSKLYNFIKEHGGMSEWNIMIIEYYPCNNVFEAKEREAYLIKLFNSQLNTNIPNRTNKEWRLLNKDKYNNYMKNYMRTYKHKISLQINII